MDAKDLYILDDSKLNIKKFFENTKLFINHQVVIYYREYNFKDKSIKLVYKIKPTN